MIGNPRVMGDHQQSRPCGLQLRLQQIKEFARIVMVKRGSRFIRQNDLRRADQRACRRDPLLLADAQLRRWSAMQVRGNAKPRQEPFRTGMGIACLLPALP